MMWNQINILIYLSLIVIEFYFAEMSIVIIRKNYFGHDTIARTNYRYLPYSLLNCENQVVCKKNLSHLRLPPLNVLNNKLHNYSI